MSRSLAACEFAQNTPNYLKVFIAKAMASFLHLTPRFVIR